MSTAVASQSTEPGRRRLIVKELIHEQILTHIRQDIISNRWEPGHRLSEPDLCREFGVSRTPMREALKVLETEGLVILRPHVVLLPGLAIFAMVLALNLVGDALRDLLDPRTRAA